jgi:hypothetical protein
MDWCVIAFLSAVGFFLTSLHLFFLNCTVLFTLWVVFGFSFFFGFSLVLCGLLYQYGGGFSS